MAEEGKAQSKLGELFVDLGVGGLGKTLKALNSVSATFLMTKHAATQALKPIVDISKEGGNLAVTFEKLKSVTGVTEDTWGRVYHWAHRNSVEFSQLSNVLGNVQQRLLKAQAGLDPEFAMALQNIGVDALRLDVNKPLEIIDTIQAALKNIDNPAVKAAALNIIGLPQDFVFALERSNEKFSQAIAETESLRQEEIDAQKRQNKAWKEIGDSLEVAAQRIVVSLPIITEGLEKTAQFLGIFAKSPKQVAIDLTKKQIGKIINKNPLLKSYALVGVTALATKDLILNKTKTKNTNNITNLESNKTVDVPLSNAAPSTSTTNSRVITNNNTYSNNINVQSPEEANNFIFDFSAEMQRQQNTAEEANQEAL